jgi:D-alanine-D-alanine ligase-like ATP-grasp enzyme
MSISSKKEPPGAEAIPVVDVKLNVQRRPEDETLTPKKKVRVCILNSSYDGSDSPMKAYDDLNVGPHHYFDKDDPEYEFTVYPLKKATAYREIRGLAKSGKFDVFYNLCDGGKDEDRCGVEACAALMEFGVPFTGVQPQWYELAKPDMKMIAYYHGICTAKAALVESVAEAEKKCAPLRFPLLIKHPSGWSSVGMTKDCKCPDMPRLLTRLQPFLEEYQVALIEEFIAGDEVTVLACGDSTAPNGVRVFQPVMVSFPPGEDFKHFDLKWVGFDGMEWVPLPRSHPSYERVMKITVQSFKWMLHGVGYGRVDLRIDNVTGEPYFLEINSQPGMMYPPGQEASSDWIMKLDQEWNHRSFAILQMQEAIRTCEARKPRFYRDFDHERGYHLRAARRIAKGEIVLKEEGRPQRLFTRPWIEKNWLEPKELDAFKTSAWPVGRDGHIYAVWDQDPSTWQSFNHSCEPNMTFDVDRSLNCVAIRDIAADEELTMDYRTFMDATSKPFECKCGSSKCAGRITYAHVPEGGLLESPTSTPPMGSTKPTTAPPS